MQPYYTAAILGGLFLVLFGWERHSPLRTARTALARRLFVNVGISAWALGTAALIVDPVAVTALQQILAREFGLLHWVELPAAAQFVVGFVLMDIAFYYWHVANHRIRLLWRFHNVHHIDPDLDVSTAFRFHLGEVALSAGFRVVQIAAIGVSPLTFAIYELVYQANTLFHHSNVHLPLQVERLLHKILVTPRMHGIHHSEVWRENNSNYSVVFPWWDRLHRTLRLNIPQSRIVIGIPAYMTSGDNRLGNALLLPFLRQRNYWRRADGTAAERSSTDIGSPSSCMEE